VGGGPDSPGGARASHSTAGRTTGRPRPAPRARTADTRDVCFEEGDSMVASRGAGGPGLRYGVSSMWSPLRRVLVRRPATAGDFADAGWRRPDPGLLSAQHEAFCQLLASLRCEVGVAAAPDRVV